MVRFWTGRHEQSLNDHAKEDRAWMEKRRREAELAHAKEKLQKAEDQVLTKQARARTLLIDEMERRARFARRAAERRQRTALGEAKATATRLKSMGMILAASAWKTDPTVYVLKESLADARNVFDESLSQAISDFRSVVHNRSSEIGSEVIDSASVVCRRNVSGATQVHEKAVLLAKLTYKKSTSKRPLPRSDAPHSKLRGILDAPTGDTTEAAFLPATSCGVSSMPPSDAPHSKLRGILDAPTGDTTEAAFLPATSCGVSSMPPNEKESSYIPASVSEAQRKDEETMESAITNGLPEDSRYVEAEDACTKAIEVAKASCTKLDEEAVAEAYVTMGDLLCQRAKTEDAKEAYHYAWDWGRECGTRRGEEIVVIAKGKLRLFGETYADGQREVDRDIEEPRANPQQKQALGRFTKRNLAGGTADLEMDSEFKHALSLMEHGDKNLFITGRAGTGKSTLLQRFKDTTKKKVVVLAPTGVAALNIKGRTIHSFFVFKPGDTPDEVRKSPPSRPNEVYRKLDAIVIDEVSMVRAELLDCVDERLRQHGLNADKPFGGIRMIFVGDLYQLPPVVNDDEKAIFETLYDTPYFFSAKVWEGSFEADFVELEKVRRQTDTDFIHLLNAVRDNSAADEDLAKLNTRYLPDAEVPTNSFQVRITTTNDMADTVNKEHLEKLGTRSYTFDAEVNEGFEGDYPTAKSLQVKVGSQVMMLNNDTERRWVNGSIGQIGEINPRDNVIKVKLDNGVSVDVTRYTWEINKLYVDKGILKTKCTGIFTQFPLTLAWAVTIHKSQGKTFNSLTIDFGDGAFARGQAYVALSRCRTLEGILLVKPIKNSDIIADDRIRDFLSALRTGQTHGGGSMPKSGVPTGSAVAVATLKLDRVPVKLMSAEDKKRLIEKTIEDGGSIEIDYLNYEGERSTRTVRPLFLEKMELHGKQYLHMRAFCNTRNEERTFRLDRILDVRRIPDTWWSSWSVST